jgi:O-6-methylguanine DNA methyltransferase
MRLLLDRYDASISPILIVTDAEGNLRALQFADDNERMQRLLRTQNGDYELSDGAAPPSIIRALDAYFEGDLVALDDVPVATGGTPFQREVWRALRAIPAGKTSSYGQLAAQLGRPTATRAVGAANGANPISIVVPCHRVIGASGALTGYGGGLLRKRWLLDHERRHCQANTLCGSV